MKASRYHIGVFFVLAFFLFSSCAEKNEEKSEPGWRDYLALGKVHLAQGQREAAQAAFENSLAINPETDEARFGIFLCGLMQISDFVGQVMESIDGLTFKGRDVNNKSASTGTAMSDPIHDYIDKFLLSAMERNEEIYEQLSDLPDFRFHFVPFDLVANGSKVISFSGDFDRTDLRFLGAVNAFLAGALHFLMAYNLDYDVQALVLPKTDPNRTTFETIDAYMKMIEDLLASERFPYFLMVAGSGGVDSLRAAGVDFGNGFTRIHSTFDSLAEEEGDGENQDQIRYYDAGGDGRYDVHYDTVYLGDAPILGPVLAEALYTLTAKMAAVFYEGSPQDADPEKIDELSPADLNELLMALNVLPLALGDSSNPFYITGFPGWFSFDVGGFFSTPQPSGLRDLLGLVVRVWDIVDIFI
jgi:hypothetical protein